MTDLRELNVTTPRCYEMLTTRGVRQGVSDHTCQSDGTWSEELPYCRLIKCPTMTFRNGNYSDSSYSGYCGSERSFTCYDGYTLNGNSRLICGEDGRWSGPPPTCEPNPCSSDKLDIENGYYETTIHEVC